MALPKLGHGWEWRDFNIWVVDAIEALGLWHLCINISWDPEKPRRARRLYIIYSSENHNTFGIEHATITHSLTHSASLHIEVKNNKGASHTREIV